MSQRALRDCFKEVRESQGIEEFFLADKSPSHWTSKDCCPCSGTMSCLTLCDPMTAARQASLSITNSWSLLKTHVHWVGDAIQPSHPLLSPSPLAFNLSQHQDLIKWVSSLHQVAKGLEFQLQHQFFQSILRTDFFRKHWFYLIALQRTLKSSLQHHSSKASIIQCSVQCCSV